MEVTANNLPKDWHISSSICNKLPIYGNVMTMDSDTQTLKFFHEIYIFKNYVKNIRIYLINMFDFSKFDLAYSLHSYSNNKGKLGTNVKKKYWRKKKKTKREQ